MIRFYRPTPRGLEPARDQGLIDTPRGISRVGHPNGIGPLIDRALDALDPESFGAVLLVPGLRTPVLAARFGEAELTTPLQPGELHPKPQDFWSIVLTGRPDHFLWGGAAPDAEVKILHEWKAAGGVETSKLKKAVTPDAHSA